VQQRLDLLHFLVSGTVLHRCGSPARTSSTQLRPTPASGNSRVRRVRHSLFHHTAHPAPDDGDDDANKRKVGSAVRRQDLQCRLLLCSGLLFPQISSHRNLTTRQSPQVYECMVRGIAVMRRRADSYVNATQILKVAGVEKGRRTKILEKEILPGRHEIVQGGYGKYQGTWYASLLVKQTLFLTSALGFPSNEVKNWLSATVWPLCYRPCLTSSRPPLRGIQCNQCQVKPSPLNPPRLPGHYLHRRHSRVWEGRTAMVLEA